MQTENPLPETDPSTALYDLTPDQIEALETWYRELHGYAECDTLRSIISHGHMWGMTLGDWIEQEAAIAAAQPGARLRGKSSATSRGSSSTCGGGEMSSQAILDT